MFHKLCTRLPDSSCYQSHVVFLIQSLPRTAPKRGADRDLGAAPDGDADALAGMLLAVLSLERLSQAQAAPEWLEEAMKPVVRSHCWR